MRERGDCRSAAAAAGCSLPAGRSEDQRESGSLGDLDFCLFVSFFVMRACEPEGCMGVRSVGRAGGCDVFWEDCFRVSDGDGISCCVTWKG